MHTAVCMRGLPLWAQNEAYNVGREKDGGLGNLSRRLRELGMGLGTGGAVRGGFGTGIYGIDDFNGKTFVTGGRS